MSRQEPQRNDDELRKAPLAVRAGPLFVTNVIKLTGVVIAVKEVFFPLGDRDPVVLALAGFMLAGAQGAEEILMAFLNSFFGRHKEPK